jgi:PAS domain S-box-containing protein
MRETQSKENCSSVLEGKNNGNNSELHKEIEYLKSKVDELQTHNTLLKSIIDNLPDAIYIKDLECRKVIANKADLTNMGLNLESEVIGKTDFDLFPKEIAEGFYADDKQVITTGTPINNREEYLINGKGKKQWLLSTKIPIKDDCGNVKYMIGIGRDITELAQAKEILREEKEKFKTIFENAFDGISIFEKDPETGKSRLVDCNSRYAEMSGRSKEELLSTKDPKTISIAISKEKISDKNITYRGLFSWKRPDGKDNIIQYAAVPVKLRNKTFILAIDRDVTEQKRSEEALKKAYGQLEKKNTELENANKVKGQFLANMSHEIRTPLNAIIGMTGLLMETPLNPEQQDYARTVYGSGDILLCLINDILDFSKIEAQKIELEKQPFDIRQCIEEALDLTAAKAAEKNLELTYFMSENLSSNVVGDVTRLRQILVNLISNSIKFTEKGEVVISVSGQLRDKFEYKLHFAVKDTGLGIPLDKQDKLFQSFSQVDASTTRKFGGTGLGLVISKQLCELMGGSMWIESTGVVGEGTTFHFTILTELAVGKRIQNDMSVLAGKKILIVDDNATNREILIKQTHSLKMVPTGKASGQESLELLKKGVEFDMAILDYQMPEMDGVMLAEEIRSLDSKKKMPLILLSSYSFREKNAKESEFAATLTKPIKLAHLHNALITVSLKRQMDVAKKNPSPVQFDSEIGKCYPLRILLAEDNTINQKVALRFLDKIGYRADVAFNGIEVLEALKHQTYDIILMDVQMPEMDGEQATMQIRNQLPESQQPRIIAVTANAMKSDLDRYVSNGMDDYLVKPFKIEDLVRILIESYSHSVEFGKTCSSKVIR